MNAQALCEDLTQAGSPPPQTTEGCQDCLAEGKHDWVHLRECLECGRVGCCDSSPSRHASKHYQADNHPVMRSLEPGETWRWCFKHETIG
jgi:uncharacterized UBP type Zn finger protein